MKTIPMENRKKMEKEMKMVEWELMHKRLNLHFSEAQEGLKDLH